MKVKMRYVMMAVMMGVGMSGVGMGGKVTAAGGCKDVEIIFARGSGEVHETNESYLALKTALETKLATTDILYNFEDLDYPAIAIAGTENLGVLIGAWASGGYGNEFGESVMKGVGRLEERLNSSLRSCPETKYVLAGYSQGAIVVTKVLSEVSGVVTDKVIYTATFGDPKIYLPEGEGLIPAACRGDNLSEYRMYVPDCQAYKGILGANIPYSPVGMEGKMGTWCNKRDILCSSRMSIDDHTSYVSDNLYGDASKVIFDRITKAFGVKNTISSPHDTVILLDSTGSMGSLINKFKGEAYRLAKETLEKGGRVALYDYRDLDDPYEVKKHCDFNTCTIEKVSRALDEIRVGGGGDVKESLLSSSLKVMKDLKWKQGSTKSIVVLTDANFLSPDRDGTTFDDVVKLSKKIDPVNFYVVTTRSAEKGYVKLAQATDGKVVTDFGELSLLTDYILDRFDSLPRVEEEDDLTALEARPKLFVLEVSKIDESSVKIKFETDGEFAIVALNDGILGKTEGEEITISDLDFSRMNEVVLIPVRGEVKGEGVSVSLEGLGADGNQSYEDSEEPEESSGTDGGSEEGAETREDEDEEMFIPKAPNTGVGPAE